MTNTLNSNACSLNDDKCREIVQTIGLNLLPKLHNIAKNDDSLVMSFTSVNSPEEKLQKIIELEKQCCACLEFDVQRAGEETNVHITHIDGGESLHAALQTLLNDCCGSMTPAQ